MSIYGIMGTSASGMAAQADRLGAVADNIANVSTTGYKEASTEFSTVLANAGTLEYQSGAVETDIRRRISQQGTFSYTKSSTDLAISGDGFFVVSGPQGDVALTRAGSFVPDSNGNLTNAAGYKLLGYDITGNGSQSVVNGAVGLVPVNLSTLSLKASPTTHGALQVNLPASAGVVAAADLPSTNAAGATFTDKTSIVTYDNLGGAATLDIYFAKSADSTWEVTVYDHAQAAATGGFPYAVAALAAATLLFDPATGALSAASPKAISVAIPNGQTLNLGLPSTTQLAGEFSVQSANVNGNAPVAVKSVEISSAGILAAVYDNGVQVPSYRIPLARVPSPDNMTALPGNVYASSLKSGGMLVSDADSGGLGSIVSSALELSTVDMTSELSTMIEAQRNYTANSKVFQTGQELMDVIVNLKR